MGRAGSARGILLDSGRVLNRPASGHWFVPPRFFEHVDRAAFDAVPAGRRRAAFREAARRHLDCRSRVDDEAAEREVFHRFYTDLSALLPELGMTPRAVAAVTDDLVFSEDKYEFFPDALTAVPRLAERHVLAVVSDAWPSLERVFTAAGMRGHFSSFVVSSRLGVGKPDARMYTTALHDLGVEASEAVFVDDGIRNCDGASAVGVRPLVLCRSWPDVVHARVRRPRHGVLRSLTDL